MRVDGDFKSRRAEVALELFRDGRWIAFGRCRVVIGPSQEILASISSRWQPDALNEQLANEELQTLARALAEVQEEWPALKKELAGKIVRLRVEYHYGTGAILLCERGKAGEVIWAGSH